MTATALSSRDSIFLENAAVVSRTEYAAGQFVLRLQAPLCAARATAGSFVHIQCHALMPMRRPLSIMRAHAVDGWIEVLFKIVGDGLSALSEKAVGERVSVMGPVGKGFSAHEDRPKTLLLGGGVGIPPMVFLAEELKNSTGFQPVVLMGSEIPFPFELKTSRLPAPWAGDDTDKTIPLLESWGIPARLTSLAGYVGCYEGYVTDLARNWLHSLSETERLQVEIFACGPTPMLRAVAALAQEFELPCQVSLEEFMACAVGGCAGCTVPVATGAGVAMQRVCVDGPVFEAAAVFPDA